MNASTSLKQSELGNGTHSSVSSEVFPLSNLKLEGVKAQEGEYVSAIMSDSDSELRLHALKFRADPREASSCNRRPARSQRCTEPGFEIAHTYDISHINTSAEEILALDDSL